MDPSDHYPDPPAEQGPDRGTQGDCRRRGQEAACFRGYGPRAGRAGGPWWRLLAGSAALVNVAAARQSHPE